MSREQIKPSPAVSILINAQWCKGCGLCVGACQKKVFSLNLLGKAQTDNMEQCIGCGTCEIMCPDYAIRVIKSA